MIEPENRKDSRRKSLQNSFRPKSEISEEQKFLKKSKKELKKKIEDTRAEEAWEDWELPEE